MQTVGKDQWWLVSVQLQSFVPASVAWPARLLCVKQTPRRHILEPTFKGTECRR
jgi:hypothetical protein